MHQRLIYIGKVVVEEACKQVGIYLIGKDNTFYKGYIIGKMTNIIGKEVPIQGNKLFDFVYIDLVIYKNPSYLEYQYSIYIIDVQSNYYQVKFIRTKSIVFDALYDQVTIIYNQTNTKIKILGIDGGIEFGQSRRPFFDSNLNTQVRKEGIIVYYITLYTLQINGKIEYIARDIVDKTRSTIIAYTIPEYLQPFVIETVVQVINILPIRANEGYKSLYKKFTKALGILQSAQSLYIYYFYTYFYKAYYYIKL